ncbi:MAG TPA: FG-GAP repeat protein, partial [Myxococcota bacterium]|nr:FG-GAP repeat protein [Myxococcota bacterium]
MEWTPDQTIDPPSARLTLFGTDVSGAGDLDADGYADVVLCGAVLRGEGGCTLEAGGPLGVDDARVVDLGSGDTPAPLFGVFPLGDATGDGVDDLGSLGVPVAARPDSFALVWYGVAGELHAEPSLRLDEADGAPVDPNVGVAAGDVDGDGLGDLVVLPIDDAGIITWPGAPGGPSVGSRLSLPEVGAGAAGGGDLDGDGYADVIVRACADGHLVERVLLGSPTGLTRGQDIERTAGCGLLAGSSVAIIGDVDGDGFDDAAFGLPPEGGQPRRVELRLGSATGLVDPPAAVLVSGQAGDAYGAILAGAGDLDHDGHADLAVTATSWSQGNGRVYVYFGGAGGLPADATLTITGARHGLLGTSVRAAGDVDGDGYDDLLIGEPGTLIQPGAVYVVLGRSFDEDGDGARVDVDCRDDRPAVHPGAEEVPGDGVDQDCDGQELCYADGDGDGARSETLVPADRLDCGGRTLSPPDDPVDCDDEDARRHPGAVDTPGDGVDQDCDGADAEPAL